MTSKLKLGLPKKYSFRDTTLLLLNNPKYYITSFQPYETAIHKFLRIDKSETKENTYVVFLLGMSSSQYICLLLWQALKLDYI